MARIIGVHSIIYSKKPEADRAFLRDVMGFRSVDVGEGWLIVALPPAEVAIHPTDHDHDGSHELYLMVDDVDQFVSAMAERGVGCTAARDLRWGVLTNVTLPGGGRLGVYQPRHARPPLPKLQSRPRRRAARMTKSARSARRRTKG